MATTYNTKTNGPRESTSSSGSGIKLSTSSISSTLEEEVSRSSYRTSIAPRNVIIQRTSYSGLGSNPGRPSTGYTRERSMQYGTTMAAVPPGAYGAVTSSGVNNVMQSREKEKRDMQDLNERFASYIEKVRFLEAQNRRLADELDRLKSQWGKETNTIKMMYQAELDEARKFLDDATKEKSRLEIRVSSLEDQLDEALHKLEECRREVGNLKEKIERQNQQLSDLEAEVNLLRRRCESADQDREKDKRNLAQLQDALNKARADLDNETLLHIDAENRRQTLEEELEFLKSVHDQELKELSALAYRDTTNENREFWKNEMGHALREIQNVYDEKLDVMRTEMESHYNLKIQNVYDEKLDVMRTEMESHYNLKIQEFRTGAAKQNMESLHTREETKRLKSQIGDLRDKLNDLEAKNNQLQRELNNLRREKEERERELEDENHELKSEVAKLRAELEAILQELQNIMDTKLGLELEIAAYRKLLEGEENRIGLRSAIDAFADLANKEEDLKKSPINPLNESAPRRSPVKGEMSARTTYQKSAKGPVTIPECASDGKFVQLENTGRKDETLGNWMIKRTVDGVEKPKFKFSADITLKPGARIKVWSKGSKPNNAPDTDLETDELSWGVGADIITRLCNTFEEDRASHIQRTVYTQ